MIRALTSAILIFGFFACHEIKSGAPPSSAWSFK